MRRRNILRKRPVVSDNTTSCSAARTPPSEPAPCDSADGFDDPELMALGHAILVKQCELGFGYPVAASEVPEQAVITSHNRADFLKMTMLLLGWGGRPVLNSPGPYLSGDRRIPRRTTVKPRHSQTGI